MARDPRRAIVIITQLRLSFILVPLSSPNSTCASGCALLSSFSRYSVSLNFVAAEPLSAGRSRLLSPFHQHVPLSPFHLSRPSFPSRPPLPLPSLPSSRLPLGRILSHPQRSLQLQLITSPDASMAKSIFRSPSGTNDLP
jgi:hypothetical protein